MLCAEQQPREGGARSPTKSAPPLQPPPLSSPPFTTHTPSPFSTRDPPPTKRTGGGGSNNLRPCSLFDNASQTLIHPHPAPYSAPNLINPDPKSFASAFPCGDGPACRCDWERRVDGEGSAGHRRPRQRRPTRASARSVCFRVCRSSVMIQGPRTRLWGQIPCCKPCVPKPAVSQPDGPLDAHHERV